MKQVLLRSALYLCLASLAACSKDADSSDNQRGYHAVRPDTDTDVVVDKLRTFCGACHAVGNLKFITSDNNQFVWDFIYNNNAPNSQKKWADAIHQVLSWPTDAAPAFDHLMIPPNQDWMPKGSKRLSFADDKIGDKRTRQVILESLEEGKN